ncbi:MAG TPA: DUF167 domain-containing protein [Candidatus Korarchaeota archaeon]|nr:DUF167 domain-containing protein [Candidatus Korarchaeota archaeon]
MSLVRVRVIPRARSEGITEEGEELVVRVREPPEGGRANRRVVELIARHYGVPKSKVEIVRGHRSREKLVKVED